MRQIALGTWSWGNKLLWGYNPNTDDIVLEETFKEAINGEINLIDTADSYGTGALNGRSEQLIGKFIEMISSQKKEKITTKFLSLNLHPKKCLNWVFLVVPILVYE